MPRKPKAATVHPQKGRDYRLEPYFVGGKMKHRRIPLIANGPIEEFLRAHATDGFLVEEGYLEILHERECERDQADPKPLFKDADDMIPS